MLVMCKSANRRGRALSSIELNGQFLEIVEKFCYLGGTIGVRGSAFYSVITKDQK